MTPRNLFDGTKWERLKEKLELEDVLLAFGGANVIAAYGALHPVPFASGQQHALVWFAMGIPALVIATVLMVVNRE